jgi:hypothetical protein
LQTENTAREFGIVSHRNQVTIATLSPSVAQTIVAALPGPLF